MTLEAKTSWTLAHLAGCADPDEHDGRGFSADQNVEPCEGSPGAQFLRSIEDSVNDYDELDDDTASEIADGAIPVYTRNLWETFTDLAAYTEDPSELGYTDTDDMDKLASACLYLIGSRLAAALVEERNENEDDA